MTLMETLHGSSLTADELLKISLNTLFFTKMMAQKLLKFIIHKYFSVWSRKCHEILNFIKGFKQLQYTYTEYFLIQSFYVWRRVFQFIKKQQKKSTKCLHTAIHVWKQCTQCKNTDAYYKHLFTSKH